MAEPASLALAEKLRNETGPRVDHCANGVP